MSNEKEARLALQDKDSGLEQISRRLIKITNMKSLIMKLGSEGFIVYDEQKSEENKKTVRHFRRCQLTLWTTGAGFTSNCYGCRYIERC